MKFYIKIFLSFILILSVVDGIGLPALRAQGASVLTRQALSEKLHAFIKSQMPRRIVKFNAEIRNLPESVEVPSGPVQIEIEPLSRRKIKGNIILKMVIQGGQNWRKKLIASAKITTYENVLVAGHNYSRHDRLDNRSLRIECRETTGLTQTLIQSASKLDGLRMKRPVSKGSILTENMVEPIPLVNRGDIVTLIIESQNMYVTALGKALKDGGMDNTISVKNLDSKKQLKGKVIGPNKVLIQP